MIFDYPNKKFIEDGRTDRLQIRGFAFVSSTPVTSFSMAHANDVPCEDKADITRDVEFIFANGALRVVTEGRDIKNISNLFFIMSDSEISNAQKQQYENLGNHQIKHNVFELDVKKALQSCIEKLASSNGIIIGDNINFFNDKFILYMFPLLRSLTNSSTNFYKILEDIRVVELESTSSNYALSFDLLKQNNLNDAVKYYIGTSSKEITKWIASRLIRKTDLVKSLSPQLLEILTNQSGRIFQSISDGVVESNVKILTCYEDVILDLFMYVKYIMEIFSNNVDHVQTFLKTQESANNDYKTDKRVADFLKNNFSAKKIFNILQAKENYIGLIQDTLNQFTEYKNATSIPNKLKTQFPNGLELPKNWKTLRELHDKVSVDYNKIKAADNNKTIEYSETEFQLHGMVQDNIEFVLPSEGATLVEWGKDQEHCVASYADRAAQKACIILGVKLDGDHQYTLEIRTHRHITPVPPTEQIAQGFEEPLFEIERIEEYSYQIQQFHGKGNRSPEHYGHVELRGKVKEMLTSVFTKGITNEEFAVQGRIEGLQRALEAGQYNGMQQAGVVQIEDLAPALANAQIRHNQF